MRSRLPWAAYSRLPRSAATLSPGGNQGARATTPRTPGSSATWTAVRPPIEWPRRQTGTSPSSSRTAVERAPGVGDAPGTAVPAAVGEAQQPGADVQPPGRRGRCRAAWSPYGATTGCGRPRPRARSALPPWSITTTARGRTPASYRVRRGSMRGHAHRTVFGAVDPGGSDVRAGRQDVSRERRRRGSTRGGAGRAPGDRRADRGRALALLRARRPDPVRRRLRRAAAAAPGARGGSSPSCARPTRRPRRSAARSRPSFTAVDHLRRMESLDNAFSYEELAVLARAARARRRGGPRPAVRAQGRRAGDQPALRRRPAGAGADPRRRPHRRGRHAQRQDRSTRSRTG